MTPSSHALKSALSNASPDKWVLVIGNGVNHSVLKDFKAVQWGAILTSWLGKVRPQLEAMGERELLLPLRKLNDSHATAIKILESKLNALGTAAAHEGADFLRSIRRQIKLTAPKHDIVKMLIDSGDGDLLIEAADIILSLLRPRSRLRRLLHNTFGNLLSQRKPPQPGVACWQTFFNLLRDSVKNGNIRCPAIATTNFDDIVAQLLECHVRCWNLAGRAGRATTADMDGAIWQQINNNTPVGSKCRPVPPHLRRISGISQLEEMRNAGLIDGEDMMVYHLHGWWALDETLVFDAAGYETSPSLITEELKIWLKNNEYVVIFIGVGEGMFDRRFTRLWRDDTPQAGAASLSVEPWSNNFWLVADSGLGARANLIGASPHRLHVVEAPFLEQAEILCDSMKTWSSRPPLPALSY